MNRTILGVALVGLTGLVACGGVAPDDPGPVAGDYSPVKFTFGEDYCGLQEAISALTDAKYTFGRTMLSEDRDSGDVGRSVNEGLGDVIEAGATDLWNLCSGFPDLRCDLPATLIHFERWKDAAMAATGCSEAELIEGVEPRWGMNGYGEGLFLNEKELILKETIELQCGSRQGEGDDTASPGDGDYTHCYTHFSMRLKR